MSSIETNCKAPQTVIFFWAVVCSSLCQLYLMQLASLYWPLPIKQTNGATSDSSGYLSPALFQVFQDVPAGLVNCCRARIRVNCCRQNVSIIVIFKDDVTVAVRNTDTLFTFLCFQKVLHLHNISQNARNTKRNIVSMLSQERVCVFCNE